MDICIRDTKTYWEDFFDYIWDIEIKWYCKGCMWQRGRYDCSGFISLYLIEKWIIKRKLNSYIFANYWIRISKDKLQEWDLIIIISNWWNHTSYFKRIENWNIIITDTYEKKTEFTERKLSTVIVWDNQKVYYIWNPIKYWFNKDFFKYYKNFIWKKYYDYIKN